MASLVKQFSLFALFVALCACTNTQEAPAPETRAPDGSVYGLDGPSEFSAAPSAKMTLSEWNALVQQVKNLPGARVDEEGPMLTTVSVGAPNEPSFYLFTRPAHPAHPAYLKAFPSSTAGSETTVVAGYAGSRSEFEAFVRAFLENMRRRQ